MRFLVFVTVLLGAQLVREANAKPALDQMFGLGNGVLESIFGLKMEELEERISDLETDEIRMALESRSDLSASEVLDILKRVKDASGELYGWWGSYADYIRISERDPEMCNLQWLKRIIVLHPAFNNMERVPTIRENIGRYCRQRFNELFDYCLKETKGTAFTERIRGVYQESLNSVGVRVDELSKVEKFIMGPSIKTLLTRLNESPSDPAYTLQLLEAVLDDSVKLSDDFTIKDFRLITRRHPSLCTLEEFKRRIVMHQGNDPSTQLGRTSTFNNNLAAFGREQFNGLVEYCLKESKDKEFRRKIAVLYKISEKNKPHQEAALLTPMELVILEMA